YTVEEGLRILLQGTGLAAAKADGTGIIAIRPAGPAPGEAQAGSAAAGNGSAEGQRAASMGEGTAGAAAASEGAQIVVTGTHIRNTDPLSPLKTVTRADIQSTGVGTISDYLERLPQNFGSASPQYSGFTAGSSAAANNDIGARAVDL